MAAMPSAPRTARALARAELTRAILDRASVQLAEVGPAALSVRQIARDLEMASSAVYRYFPSRDALLTALLIQAFDDLGQAVEDGDASARARRLPRSLGRPRAGAARLGGGAPARVRAHLRLTGPRVRRAAGHHRLGHAGLQRRCSPCSSTPRRPAAPPPRPTRPATEAELASIAPVRSFVGEELDEAYSIRGLMAWATLFGNISLELFGHMFKGVLDYEAHYATLVEQLADDLGL